MTIQEYLNGLEETEKKFKGITQQMLNSTQIWNNEAAKGYSIIAMQRAGLNENQIADILAEMTEAFSNFTVEQAEENYCKYCSM